MSKLPKNTHRIDANRIRVDGQVPAVIFANREVAIESKALVELEALLELQDTVQRVYQETPESFSEPPRIEEVVLTPDFHKGAGIPIGTVLKTRGFVAPQAIGNDVNCGVRLHTTSLDQSAVKDNLDQLEETLRGVFFEGGRSIPFTREQRIRLLEEGLVGLLDVEPPSEGVWAELDRDQLLRDLERVRHLGSFSAGGIFGLQDYVGAERVSRDSQIGSIGGGNHFVELQVVTKIHKGQTAHAWGLELGRVVVMVHSGSVSIGHLCGEAFREATRRIYPSGLQAPNNGIFPLPDNTPEHALFQTSLANAGNFAFANRMFLALMARQGLERVLGAHEFELLYDSPHNYAWKQPDGGVIHRKGACPAGGIGASCDPYFGEVVLMPGSMGSASFVMEGLDCEGSLSSASHGAGRLLSRGEALRQDESKLDTFLSEFRVVTPVDPKRPDIRSRREILSSWREGVKKEAPFAYKDIYPVVDTLRDARIADPVAEVQPLLTLKA